MASSNYLLCFGCGRRRVRIKNGGRHRCDWCLTTWLTPEDYAKGLKGRLPLEPALTLYEKEKRHGRTHVMGDN